MIAPSLPAQLAGLVLFVGLVAAVSIVHRAFRRRRLYRQWAATNRSLSAQTGNAPPAARYGPPPPRHASGPYRHTPRPRASRRRAS